MRRLTYGACPIGMLVTALAAAQAPPAIDPIPAPVAASQPVLVQQRQALTDERSRLRERTDSHNSRCASVPEGSAEETQCRSNLSQLRADMGGHVARTQAFNNALRAASVTGVAPAVATAIDIQGDVLVTFPDGRQVSSAGASQITLQAGTQIRTRSGSMTLTFPDQTRITIGPLSSFTLTQVSMPRPGFLDLLIDMPAGVVRWATGSGSQPRIRMPTVITSVRGTDFECAVAANGEETVKVHSGEVDVTVTGGRVITIPAGRMVSVRDGQVSGPQALR